jgi:uridine phosphorylase
MAPRTSSIARSATLRRRLNNFSADSPRFSIADRASWPSSVISLTIAAARSRVCDVAPAVASKVCSIAERSASGAEPRPFCFRSGTAGSLLLAAIVQHPTQPAQHPAFLRPCGPVAADALLPGDPGRALALAQILMVKPLMANHARGLWGYHGTTEAGHELTIQSTGIGGPSAAVVLSELAELGLQRALRVGTCRALDPSLELGQVVAASAAVAEEGGSGAEDLVEGDEGLTAALLAEGIPALTVASTDRFYETDPLAAERRRAQGAAAVEMGAATLFELGRQLGLRIGCLLVVAELPGPGNRRIGDEQLAESAAGMGRVGLAALAATR